MWDEPLYLLINFSYIFMIWELLFFVQLDNVCCFDLITKIAIHWRRVCLKLYLTPLPKLWARVMRWSPNAALHAFATSSSPVSWIFNWIAAAENFSFRLVGPGRPRLQNKVSARFYKLCWRAGPIGKVSMHKLAHYTSISLSFSLRPHHRIQKQL